MRLDLDAEIRYEGGELAGHLHRIGMDQDNSVNQVVISTADLVSRRVIAPLDMLREDESGGLVFTGTADELSELPDYEEERIPVIGEGWEFSENVSAIGEVFPATTYEPIVPIMEVSNLDEGSVSISVGTEVWCLDGRWGVVEQVLMDENDTVQSLLARPDDLEANARLIPIQLMQEADTNRVLLNCTLLDLPNYSEEQDPEIDNLVGASDSELDDLEGGVS